MISNIYRLLNNKMHCPKPNNKTKTKKNLRRKLTFIWFIVSLSCSSWWADDSASSRISVSFMSFSCSCCCSSSTDSSWLAGRRTNLRVHRKVL